MIERPILFSGPMVLAIIEGRKTQTRRVAKLTNAGHVKEPRGHRRWHPGDPDAVLACPYGQPGDRLWVRETWSGPKGRTISNGPLFFRADGEHQCGKQSGFSYVEREGRWRPSIYMPRWASRLTLEIAGVRVERLHDISEDDAKAEGVEAHWDDGVWYYGPLDHGHCSAVVEFGRLWDSINAKRGFGWDANPIVWALTFSVRSRQ